MRKQTLYWLCQLGGWAVFTFYDLSQYAIFTHQYRLLMLNGLLNVLLGIGITHLYRIFILRNNWLELPIAVLLPRAAVATAAITLVMSGLNIPLDMWMFPEVFPEPLTWKFWIYSVLGWGKYIIIWVSFYHLFHYAERMALAQVEKSQMERQLAEMELQRLRSQLNPHFLFNALNSLRALVAEDPAKAQLGLTWLANLLRQALKNDLEGTVPMWKELQTVRDYLELEALRLEDRLQLEWDLDPAADAAPVPAMLVFTLVENAIKHGVAQQAVGGVLRLRSRVEPNLRVVFEIRNTGRYEPRPEHDGFGILNSERRLLLTFGPRQATLDISQESDDIVLTRLVLPLSNPPLPTTPAFSNPDSSNQP